MDLSTYPSLVDLKEWDQTHFWHGFTQMSAYHPLIIREAVGCELIDVNGKRYIDGVSSLWCNVHGHRHPRLDQAVRDQLGRVAHVTSLGMACDTTVRLARALAELAPGDLNHVFFSDDGSTALEAALKIAFQFWKQCDRPMPTKRRFVTFQLAYHGDTIGSVSLGGIPLFHQIFGSLLFESIRVPTPDTYRLPDGVAIADAATYYLEPLERVLSDHHQDVAAVVLEPLIQGAGGMIMHPPGFLGGVRELTSKYDVLLILDEVAVGMGRTGTMFACQQEQVVPDLLCLAKGLTAGYLPLAATLATTRVWDAFLGQHAEAKTFFHGHTYGGNPLSAAVALANLQVFEDEHTLERLQPKIERLEYHLRHLAKLAPVGSARNRGFIAGIELVADRQTKERFPWQDRRGARVCQRAIERGVWLRPLGDVIVVMPPLCIDQDQLDSIGRAIHESIQEEFELRN